MPYVVIARVLTQPWHLRVSVFSDHLCASPLFRREGDLQISKILKDCWMKATLEHNTGPVSPDCMGGYKCQEYVINKPQASCIVEGSRCCYRGALHTWVSWGLTLDAKEVHTRFPLILEN